MYPSIIIITKETRKIKDTILKRDRGETDTLPEEQNKNYI
jgi:hypothetical protein